MNFCGRSLTPYDLFLQSSSINVEERLRFVQHFGRGGLVYACTIAVIAPLCTMSIGTPYSFWFLVGNEDERRRACFIT